MSHQPTRLRFFSVIPTISIKILGVSTSAAALLSSAILLHPQSASAVDPTSTPVAQVPSSSPSSTSYPQVSSDTRFTCEMANGQYTVVYHPQSQPDKSYPWATPTELGGGWTPELRCNEISRRLESYRPDGLQEMQIGLENGYNTVCVTTQRDSSCRIVLTVPPGQDPRITRDRVFENLTVADSGQQTDSVVTYADGGDGNLINRIGEALDVDLSSLTGRRNRTNQRDSIDLRPFLAPEDGGTGARLQSTSAAPRLNPNNFR